MEIRYQDTHVFSFGVHFNLFWNVLKCQFQEIIQKGSLLLSIGSGVRDSKLPVAMPLTTRLSGSQA